MVEHLNTICCSYQNRCGVMSDTGKQSLQLRSAVQAASDGGPGEPFLKSNEEAASCVPFHADGVYLYPPAGAGYWELCALCREPCVTFYDLHARTAACSLLYELATRECVNSAYYLSLGIGTDRCSLRRHGKWSESV